MRQAYSWLYAELDAGRSRRSVLRRASGRVRSSVKEAFKLYDKLEPLEKKNTRQYKQKRLSLM